MKEKKKFLTDQIHDSILEMVIQLSSEDQDTIFTEGSLVEQFGVSKAPVREALVKLCSEGVLRSMPRYGYVIVRLGEKDARDIIQYREILERNAMLSCFDSLTETDLERLGQHLSEARGRRDMNHMWDVWEDNIAFHCLLISLTGNSFLVKFLQESMEIERRIYAQLHWQTKHCFEYGLDPNPHERICQAIAEKDLERALDLLQQDIHAVENG